MAETKRGARKASPVEPPRRDGREQSETGKGANSDGSRGSETSDSEGASGRPERQSHLTPQATTRGAGRKAGDNRLQAEAGRDLNGAECGGSRATIGSASTATLREENGSPLPEQASERSERANTASLAPLRMRPRPPARENIGKPLYIGALPTYRGGNSTAVLLYRSPSVKTAHSIAENIGRPSNNGTPCI